VTQNADGSYHAVVDASGDAWIYVDLLSRSAAVPSSPAASTAWDLAFKGSEVRLNGGSSGAPPTGQPVGAFASKVEDGSDYPFAAVTQAPPEGSVVSYQVDTSSALVLGTSPAADVAGDAGWFNSNSLGARENVGYVVRSVECRYFKLHFTAASDAGGAAGFPAFDFAEIPGSSCGTAAADSVAPLGRVTVSQSADGILLDLDTTDDTVWVHIDLTNAQQVAPVSPASDPTGWDIAMSRTEIKVNGGISGTGVVRIYDGYEESWEARTTAPSEAALYHSDVTDALAFETYPPDVAEPDPACFNINGDFGWYYYTGFCNEGDGIHHIYPRDVVYVVQGRDGNAWKLRVLDYYNDAGNGGHPTIEYALVAQP
jgi:hypothetical protein